MKDNDFLVHQGVVDKVSPTTVEVKLLGVSRCGSCHVKDLCVVSKNENKIIQVKKTIPDLKPGDTVTVLFQQSLVHKALWFGYVLPFILLLATVFILWSLTQNELVSGLGALSVLGPYYFYLFLQRNNLEKTFNFKIIKQ